MVKHTCNHSTQEAESEARLATKKYIEYFRSGRATQENCLKNEYSSWGCLTLVVLEGPEFKTSMDNGVRPYFK